LGICDFWEYEIFGIWILVWFWNFEMSMLHVPGVVVRINVTRVRIPKAACDRCWAFEYWC
jgi:hypothetical protein